MRLPKLSNKSQSFASGSKTSLQDKLTAKSWLFVTPTLQLGTYCRLLEVSDQHKKDKSQVSQKR